MYVCMYELCVIIGVFFSIVVLDISYWTVNREGLNDAPFPPLSPPNNGSSMARYLESYPAESNTRWYIYVLYIQ